MTTLVLHHGALGDWLLVTPLLRELVQDGGRAIGGQSPSKAALAAKLTHGVDPVTIDTPAWADLYTPNAQPDEPVRKVLAQATRIISFISTGNDAWTSNVKRLAPQAELLCLAPGPGRSVDGQVQHVTACHVAALGRQGYHYRPCVGEARVAQRTSKVRRIVVHPGSGGKAKCWPLERWESLFAQTDQDAWSFLPVLGEVELAIWPGAVIDRWTRQHGAIACHNLDDLYGQFLQCDGVIGADSGPCHLAAVMGLATLTLFGPTDPRIWRPWGPKVSVIAPPTPQPMSWLAPERVLESFQAIF